VDVCVYAWGDHCHNIATLLPVIHCPTRTVCVLHTAQQEQCALPYLHVSVSNTQATHLAVDRQREQQAAVVFTFEVYFCKSPYAWSMPTSPVPHVMEWSVPAAIPSTPPTTRVKSRPTIGTICE
jgi:hypothetical protein